MSKRSDRRKARKAARLEKRRIRVEARRQKKQDRKDNRSNKKADRRQARLDRIDRRQSGKTNRTTERQETKKTAYENGIDPNAWVGDTTKAVGDIANSFMAYKSGGMSGNLLGKNAANVSGGVTASGDSNTLMIMGAAAVGLILFLKK